MKAKYVGIYKGNESPYESGSPRGVWSQLEQMSGQSREELKNFGWRVKLKVKVDDSDIDTAADIAEAIAPAPVKGVIGLLKKLFGKK